MYMRFHPRPECLSRFQMLASILSPSDSICSGGGGTDDGSDGGSGLDLLQDEDGNFDESSGYRTRIVGRDWVGDM
nr:hypothetical protein [Tanacetum cinerariifolium]